eukprot:4467099-Prymnesium_polylepis.3
MGGGLYRAEAEEQVEHEEDVDPYGQLECDADLGELEGDVEMSAHHMLECDANLGELEGDVEGHDDRGGDDEDEHAQVPVGLHAA